MALDATILKGAQKSGKTYQVIGATLPFGEKKDPIGSEFNLLLARWLRRHLQGARGG